MDNFDKEQEEDDGIDYTDIPKVTDFSEAKRVSDYGTVIDALRIRYQEKMARAKVAAEQKAAAPETESYTERTFNRNH